MSRLTRLLLVGLSVVLGGGAVAEEKKTCNNAPGQADSHVLALSWQPAFCETAAGQGKAECREDDPAVYQASHFVLHGLWPNQQACTAPTYYSFCGSVPYRRPHCDYPAVELAVDTLATLSEIMPSVNAGTCLERHEWFKHGTCMTKTTADNYFRVAERLTREFNDSGMADFMAVNLGKRMTKWDFLLRVETFLGRGAAKRVKLTCTKDNLSQVEIKLPAKLPSSKPLGDLLRQVKANRLPATNCGDSFRIDPIGPG